MSEDRYALCFDSGREGLGEVSLRLLRMGVDVLYADSADEALLMAADDADRIHAVIVSPNVVIRDLARVVDRVARREGEPPAVVVVGERPPDQQRTALRAAGADWGVWDASDDSALRFAVNGAMTLPSEIVPRNELRVPTSLLASFRVDDARANAVVYTLSAKGAFLETPRPTPVGAQISVEIWLPEAQIETDAKVIYVNATGEGRRASWPIGLGVVFEGLAASDEEELRRYIAQQADSIAI